MVALFPHKFLRSHYVSFINNLSSYLYRFKITYEFWGFCVNGSNDLRNPGGFAATNPFNLPAGFESGSLYASGSDGITHLGEQFFSSSTGNFSENAVGRHLICWKSGSSSTDDSIYRVTQFINSGVLRVNTFEGGTPYPPANNAPYFTERDNINFRLVDIDQTVTDIFSLPSGSYMVFEFQAANDVNEGQINPQIKMGNYDNGSRREFRFHLSPSGSWNGTGFTDGQEYTPDTGSSFGWAFGSDAPGRIMMIADKCFMFHHGMGQTDAGGAGWHNDSAGWVFEVPYRIYPREIDPYPLLAMAWGQGMRTTDPNIGFAGPWMIGRDGITIRHYELLTRSPHGISWDNEVFGSNPSTVNADRKEATHDKERNEFLLSDFVLSRLSSDEHTMARVRIRNMRMIPNCVPNDSLVGTTPGNQWWKCIDYLLFPWDGARLPYRFIIEN